MNFTQKLENLAKLKELLAGKTKQMEDITKSIDTADGEKIKSLEKELSTVKSEIDDTTKSIEDLQKEVDEDEAKLKSIASDIEKNKKKEGPQSMNKDYLKTKQALSDFAEIQLKAKGDKDTFKYLWEANLKEKGITNPEVLLPQPVASAIVDAFQTSGTIYATFNHTGLTAIQVARNTEEGENSKARGHKRGTAKKEQVITLANKTIRAQYIYKYITLDKETLRENNSTNAIITYVLGELPQRVVTEVEKSAVIGDGRAEDSDDKVYALEAMTAAGAPWAVTVNRTANALIEDLVMADAEITATGTRYLVMARQTLAAMKLAKNSNGDLLYPIGTDFAGVLGVSAIFTPDWMPATPAAGEPIAVEYVGDAYKLVGDNVIESYDNFIMAQNKMEYLAELYIGGGLAELKAAATVVAASAPSGE